MHLEFVAVKYKGLAAAVVSEFQSFRCRIRTCVFQSFR